MNAFKSFFLLQPVDQKWCPLDFRVWRVFMLMGIISMVATEAPSWGYVAVVIFGGGPLAYVAGFTIGLIMAALILTADVGIATADVQSIRRFSIATGARVLFLIISVAFTAHYIATFVLTADIRNEWNRKNTVFIQQKRMELFGNQINNLSQQIAEKHHELDLEVEGRRKSRVGCGPICRQLQADLADLNHAVDKVQGEEQQFDRVASNPTANEALLATTYGLVLPPLTMKARNEILAELTKQPGYRATELTVRAWCVLVFIAMLLAKLAQPDSAQLVFKQSLRPWISKYEAGELDSKLLPQYRSTFFPFFMTLAYLWEFVGQFCNNEKEQVKLQLINEAKARVATTGSEAAAAQQRVDAAQQAYSVSRKRRDTLRDQVNDLDRVLADIDKTRHSLEQVSSPTDRVQGTIELAQCEKTTLQQRDCLLNEFQIADEETARHEATLHEEEAGLASMKQSVCESENELRAMQVSMAKVAAAKFASVIGSEALPRALTHRGAITGGSEPEQPLRSLAESGKAVIGRLVGVSVAGVPEQASLLRRILTTYLQRKAVAVGAIVVLICAALLVSAFFAHSMLAQLH